jgi:hypothetical protein
MQCIEREQVVELRLHILEVAQQEKLRWDGATHGVERQAQLPGHQDSEALARGESQWEGVLSYLGNNEASSWGE